MLGDKLKELRTYHGITQREMSSILKINRATYSGYENGCDTIPLIKLNEFCNYLNLSLDFVCGLTNNSNKSIIKTDIDIKDVGKRMKNIRKLNNHTQAYTSQKINISQSNYSKYELGKVLILTFSLIDFAKFYNVSIDYLCGKTNDMVLK